MNQNPNRNHHSVRRIVLPSGMSVDVVAPLVDVVVPQTPAGGPTKTGLHVCPACDSPLVQPIAWGEMSESRWELTLHCPNCDWICHGSFDHRQVAVLEEELDQGVATLLLDLKQLAGANMADEIERFAAALEADVILPEDF